MKINCLSRIYSPPTKLDANGVGALTLDITMGPYGDSSSTVKIASLLSLSDPTEATPCSELLLKSVETSGAASSARAPPQSIGMLRHDVGQR